MVKVPWHSRGQSRIAWKDGDWSSASVSWQIGSAKWHFTNRRKFGRARITTRTVIIRELSRAIRTTLPQNQSGEIDEQSNFFHRLAIFRLFFKNFTSPSFVTIAAKISFKFLSRCRKHWITTRCWKLFTRTTYSDSFSVKTQIFARHSTALGSKIDISAHFQ